MSEDLIEGRKQAPRSLGSVCVLGLGSSGTACADYLIAQLGDRVRTLVVYGGPSNEKAQAWASDAARRADDAGAAAVLTVIFDSENVSASAQPFDLCIASPGISEFSDFYQRAAACSREVISEVEFAWRESSAAAKWVAITGTNGKTTTTALCAHILQAAGIDAKAVGNIGDVALVAVQDDLRRAAKMPVYVVEVSSYQLASTRDFAPDVAVVLGIMPDHLSWHQSHENYGQAKWKILANLSRNPGAVAILDAVNDEVRAKIRELKALDEAHRGFAYIPLGTKVGIDGDMRKACGALNAAFVDNGVLTVVFDGTDHDLGSTDALKLKGAHNHLNVLAASSAAVVLGVSDAIITQAIDGFAPLEHRIEPSGEVQGVTFYNDSKATNVDATLVALSAFLPKKPYVMLGGRDKGTDLVPLVEACAAYTSGVVCFGEAKDRFYEAFAAASLPDGFVLEERPTFDKAFECLCALAKPGDIVLLSPACASFDEFSCFEERGEHFKELVAKRATLQS